MDESHPYTGHDLVWCIHPFRMRKQHVLGRLQGRSEWEKSYEGLDSGNWDVKSKSYDFSPGNDPPKDDCCCPYSKHTH